MKKTEIGRRVQEIEEQIVSLKNEKKRFQERCKHTQVSRELISNYCYKEPLEELEEYYLVVCLNCKKSFTVDK